MRFFGRDQPNQVVTIPFSAGLLDHALQFGLVAVDAQGDRGRRAVVWDRGGLVFEQGVFLLDDQLDRGVAGIGLAIQAVAHGDELVAVAFDEAFGTGLAGPKGFDNVHIVTGGASGWRSLPQ